MIRRFINWVKNEDIWDLMAWASLAMIFFWAVAKSFGWINTPAFIEMMPIFGAVFWGGRMFQQLEDVKVDVREVKKNLTEVNERLHVHDMRFVKLESRYKM